MAAFRLAAGLEWAASGLCGALCSYNSQICRVPQAPLLLLEGQVGLQHVCCMGWGLGMSLVKTAEISGKDKSSEML